MKCCVRARNGASGVADKYNLFGMIALQPGAWADWFAGASSFAAVVVALCGYWLSELARGRDEREKELAAGRLIGWKLIRLLNASHDYYRHFWVKPDATLVGLSGKVEKWRSTYPLIGSQFDPSLMLSEYEESLLLKAKASQLLMSFSLAVGRYGSIIGSVTTYQAKHEVIHALMPAPVEVDGSAVTHEMTREQVLRLQPYALQLESIIDGIRDLTHENVASCMAMFTQLDDFYVSYFGKALFKFEPAGELSDPSQLGVERTREDLKPS